MPLFQVVQQIMPKVAEKDNCIHTLKSNSEKWQKYEETDEDKKVYSASKMDEKKVLIDIDEEDEDSLKWLVTLQIQQWNYNFVQNIWIYAYF